MLTVSEKNCLPSIEKSPYRKEKKLLTVEGKNCLPYQRKKCLTFATKADEKFRQAQAQYAQAVKEENERIRKIQDRHKYMIA